MTKETLIILIEKDIAELATLTQGFSQLQTVPQPLLELSLQKAKGLVINLEQLEKLPVATEKVEPEVCQQAEIEPTQACDVEFEEIPAEPEIAPQEPEIEKVEEKIEEKAAEPTEPQKIEQKTILAETITQKTSVLENFANDENRVATAISHQKIENLKTALSIGDRFRFQRELFGGNGEQMSTALNDFNAFSSMEEAKNYIEKHFAWDENDKNVADFLELLQRKYL